MQARDALLLCMSLSKKNKNIGVYIAEHSNICVLLASGKLKIRKYLHKYFINTFTKLSNCCAD